MNVMRICANYGRRKPSFGESFPLKVLVTPASAKPLFAVFPLRSMDLDLSNLSVRFVCSSSPGMRIPAMEHNKMTMSEVQALLPGFSDGTPPLSNINGTSETNRSSFHSFARLISIGCLAAVAALVGLGWVLPSSHQLQADTDGLTLLGSGKKQKTKKTKANSKPPSCDDGNYSKRTLKLAYELPFVSLFRDTKGQKKYEASSVVVVGDDAYAVCDSSWAISKFGSSLQPFAAGNVQIGDPSREVEDSGYEALFHEDGVFYVVRESIQHEDETYHAIIEEIELNDGSEGQDYSVGQTCSCEFEFEGDSKGFEGAIAVYDLNGDMVVLGLCEGNHCSQTRKKDKGNGKLVAMRKKEVDGEASCQWSTIRTIDIPSSAFFEDYSAISLSPTGRVVLSSQEESQIWVGQLLGQNANGLWDIESMEFSSDEAVVYDFPKNDQCLTVYCNIEGVHWINDDMIMAVSDKMKSKGKQDFRCFDKDQSVHVFVLP